MLITDLKNVVFFREVDRAIPYFVSEMVGLRLNLKQNRQWVAAASTFLRSSCVALVK